MRCSRAVPHACSRPDRTRMNMHASGEPAPARGPLAGIGIVVTRPARQAGGLVQMLAGLAAHTVVFPALVILPPRDGTSLAAAHATLDTFDAAIFVSSNAAEYGAPAPGRWPATLAAFATGPGTAAALAAVGIAAVRMPESSYDSDGLLALPDLTHVGGKRIVIFRGEGGRDQLARTLRERGAQVVYAQCYRRARPGNADGLAEALLRGGLHAVTLTSAEGLDNLWALLPVAARERLAALPAFVPHPNIAAHARELGIVAVVTGPGDAGLVAGLLEWFARHPVASTA